MIPEAATIKRWRDGRGILAFVEEQFRVVPDPWQRDALLAFASRDRKFQRISLQACAGPGKTAVLAWCALWFLSTQGDHNSHPTGMAVSISADNLRGNLWRELAKWINVSPFCKLVFDITASAVFAREFPQTWRLSAKAFRQAANVEELGKTLSGLHDEYVFVLVDESGAIPPAILRSAEQALFTCKFGKILQAGNPISLTGMLHEAATTLRHLWHIIRITGDPDDPKAWVHGKRVGPGPLASAMEQIATYGRENPWIKAMILGQFPPASINALLGIEDVEAAMARRPDDSHVFMQKRLGVDVARFGDDRSVIFPRQGSRTGYPRVLRKQNTSHIAGAVAYSVTQWGGDVDLILIDDTGHWGHGVVDQLSTAGYPTHPVVFSDKAYDVRYLNRRAEMWMEMAEWVKTIGALPKDIDPQIVAELTVPTYTFVKGVFVLEEKDQIKKRLGRSPDLADGLALTFALPDAPPSIVKRIRQTSRATVEREQAFDTGRVLLDSLNPEDDADGR